MEQFYKNLGVRIKKLREKAELSQEKLAGLLGINRASVSQIENGERKISAQELSELSKIFNIAADVLLNLNQDIKVVLKPAQKSAVIKKKGIRINVPQKNVEKFKEVLIYILNKVGSKPNIGETVIYKLLYFIDFNFYEKYEEQIIGATYIKNNYGPTPVEFKKIVEQMEDKDLVRVENKYFQYPQVKYLPRRQPDLSKFKAHEIKLIDEVLEKLSDMNASQISEYSHNDIPWLAAEEGGVIDYESVFYRQSAYSVGLLSKKKKEEEKSLLLTSAETALRKDWLKMEEDKAWQNL